jgi:predicted alpha/beta hydrolase
LLRTSNNAGSLSVTDAAVVESTVRFCALDGFDLGGTLYAMAGVSKPGTAVVFSCGGGVPASRYGRFARCLAAQGFPALTYDYRGIGASRPAQLRGFRAEVPDWSEFDCGGAIAFLRSRYPGAELVGVAHSLGTLLMGGAPNLAEISRFVFVGAHTGYYKDYLRKYRLPMAVLWHGVMPVLTHACGYFPAKLLRLGEDIPAGIALQWAARRSPDFRPEATATDAPRARALIARYARVSGDVLVLQFTDDAFATEVGTRRLLAVFPGLRPHHCRIAPTEVGLEEIGHFGFFRRQAEMILWPHVVAFLRGGVPQ